MARRAVRSTTGWVRRGLRSFLSLLGKRGRKVIAVFAVSPEDGEHAVRHVREGAGDLPIWLFAQYTPWEQTVSLCERAYTGRSSLALLARAEAELWPRHVALAVTTWTGRSGSIWIKLAPFLIPPFRALVMNAHGDFFAGSVGKVLLHAQRNLADRQSRIWQMARERLAGSRRWLRRRREAWWQFLVAAALATSGAVLRRCGYPHRRWVQALRGSNSLPLPILANQGVGVIRWARKWNSEVFRQTVLGSSARWILWTEEGELAEIDDLLALFQDDRTFAVSRQCDYRAWKPGLMPTAAFRTLQPGEATQVLAPLGHVILADRQKLTALGIPDCSLPQTTWLVLFWKAAAAGWRSYTIGGARSLAEQPDFPCCEAEFFWRLLIRPELRHLKPQGEDLSRGTIVFSLHTPGVPKVQKRGKSAPMRVLIASPFLPFPLSHGGAVRIYNLCKALAGRVDFILVAIREEHDRVRYRELQEVFREVRVVDMDEIPLSDEQLPRQVRQCHSRSFATAIRELVRTHEPDLLQIEYTHMAEYRLADLGIPSILVEHDLTFSLYRQIAGREGTVESWREFETWRRFERRHLREFEGVWTVSEEDRRFAIAEGSKAEMTFAIPNGVDLTRFRPDSGTDSPGVAPEILFVGSFRHLPNLIGFERLVAEVMPRVWQKLPQARLRVVGGPYHDFYLEEFSRKAPARGSAPSVRERAMEPRIKLHGLIEDLRPFYAQAAVVVVPLQVSAGTNIKVLEAMACGKAVVTTAVGCSGLDLRHDDDALICERWDDFATAICGLVSDAELRGRIGRQARRTVKERFGWESIAEWAYKSYAALLSL